MALGHVVASAPTEGGAINEYWDGDSFSADLSAADFLEDTDAADLGIEAKRAYLGAMIQRFTDRSLTLFRVNQSITAAP
ncbi:MAG TPA: hypothetical protein V6C65_08560 [Allocoleopsis sp.]